MKKSIVADGSLLFVAFIWGTTFVIVQNAIAFLEPFSFNAVRFFIATVFLAGWVLLFNKSLFNTLSKPLIFRGIAIGFWLYLGYGFQTLGLLYTSSSKAGFITGLSVVLVPVLSVFFFKQKLTVPASISVVLAVAGLYMLTIGNSFHLNVGDFFVLIGAISFALQIILTAKYANSYPAMLLTIVQLLTVAILSALSSLFLENWKNIFQPAILGKKEVWIALIVTSLFATAIAFLAQTYFQSYTTPTRVALIFSMEPVFAAFAGLLWNNETLGARAVIGCSLILIGMILSELPIKQWFMKRKEKEWANF
ncbi:DMT family transporter [Fictibacillus gelatini]|uniref:DMT family transporter n=1 Tax=Fictibacillus gelatini TaxID=225985 RepID=UPI0003FC41F0|nr:DMT family transporter [Fictibacillus gelatini]